MVPTFLCMCLRAISRLCRVISLKSVTIVKLRRTTGCFFLSFRTARTYPELLPKFLSKSKSNFNAFFKIKNEMKVPP